ncbi:MAG: hypothetical protein ACFBSC_21000 [Microcoleaceae cyanobacterium]
MLKTIFASTVSAICYSILDANCKDVDNTSEKSEYFPHNEIVQFVLEQHQRMPDYLRLPIFILTLALEFCGLLDLGKLFHLQETSIRYKKLEQWRSSSLSIQQDLVRFYQGLTVLAWESHKISPRI